MWRQHEDGTAVKAPSKPLLTNSDYRQIRLQHVAERDDSAWPSVCSEATCDCSLEELLHHGACPRREPQRLDLDEFERAMSADVPRPLFGVDDPTLAKIGRSEVLLALLGAALLVACWAWARAA